MEAEESAPLIVTAAPVIVGGAAGAGLTMSAAATLYPKAQKRKLANNSDAASSQAASDPNLDVECRISQTASDRSSRKYPCAGGRLMFSTNSTPELGSAAVAVIRTFASNEYYRPEADIDPGRGNGMSQGTDGLSQPERPSSALERIGGKAILFVLAAMSGSAGVMALQTGELAERGSRSAPLQFNVLQGISAYTGGAFLVSISATLFVCALSGFRFRRILFALLAVNLAAFFAAVAGRIFAS